MSKPLDADYKSCDEVYTLTATYGNPNADVYTQNEESMTDREGNISQPKDHSRLFIEQVDDNTVMISTVGVGSPVSMEIDAILVEMSPLLDPVF